MYRDYICNNFTITPRNKDSANKDTKLPKGEIQMDKKVTISLEGFLGFLEPCISPRIIRLHVC